jgi:hypothetical protein
LLPINTDNTNYKEYYLSALTCVGRFKQLTKPLSLSVLANNIVSLHLDTLSKVDDIVVWHPIIVLYRIVISGETP